MVRIFRWAAWVGLMTGFLNTPASAQTASSSKPALMHPGQPTLVLQVGSYSHVLPITFSPDGKTLATAGGEGEARLWELPAGRVKAILVGHTGVIHALAFSPDGKTLATGSDDRTVRLWDARTGALKAVLRGHTQMLWATAFSPDGQTLATGSNDGSARIWEVRTGNLIAILAEPAGRVRNLAFSPDGKTLATCGARARLWDTRSWRLKATLSDQEVGRIAFTPDGKTLAGTGAVAWLWDVPTGKLKAILRGHTKGTWPLAFSPDGGTLATGGDDTTVELWDVQSGRLRRVLQGYHNVVFELFFSPDGKRLVGGIGDFAQIWDIAHGQIGMTLDMRKPVLWEMNVSRDGKTLAAGTENGQVWIWDLMSGKHTATLAGNMAQVTCLASSPDGQTVATGSYDSRVRLWNPSNGQLRAVLQGHTGEVATLDFAPDGQTLVTGGSDHTVRLWDPRTGQQKADLVGSSDVINCLAFSPDGNTLAAGTGAYWAKENVSRKPGEALLWDVRQRRLIARLQGHTSRIVAVAFSPDGGTLATRSEVIFVPGHLPRWGGVRLWDVRTGQLKSVLLREGAEKLPIFHGSTEFPPPWTADSLPDLTLGLAFSADGKRLAMRDRYSRVVLWDVATGKLLPTTVQTRLPGFLPVRLRRFGIVGAGFSVYNPDRKRQMATLLPVPDADAAAASARPIEVDAKPGPPAAPGEWFLSTPEGYFDCSANAARFVTWNLNGTLYPAERYMRRFRRPDLVQKALRGDKITAPEITNADIPPAARIVNWKDGDTVSSDLLSVTVDCQGVHAIQEVEMLVNGRPLPPEHARPIEVDAKPIEVDAKAGPNGYRVRARFTFDVPLPVGAQEVRLHATAFDDCGLGSDPVEIVLRHAGTQPVPGRLYVLSVGVSQYKNAVGNGFRNLEFPAADALAIADRFRRETGSLYERVEVRTLTDQQATLANVRAGLRWLQESVRPGQLDTVVLFLSGHGVSLDGRYYFATQDFEAGNVPATGLSAQELAEMLGGSLRAKIVFLFVDTCHAGGLSGRNDDLATEVGAGVYLLASSGSKESSYESGKWGHGAFTLALLRALDRRELARNGVIYFNALTYAVPDEVAALMKAAGRNENEQDPCVPLASRHLRVPVVSLKP